MTGNVRQLVEGLEKCPLEELFPLLPRITELVLRATKRQEDKVCKTRVSMFCRAM
jgi:hypothetical protein